MARTAPVLKTLLFLIVLVPACLSAAGTTLPFIEDDYPKALAEARARKVPIFLEAWAPWCHSCRSMKAFVYTDAKLAPYADRFVWLAIDTEKPVNAATVAKFPVGAWPSMYLIDPATETVSHRWTGSATVEQLARFLDEVRPVGGASRKPGQKGAGALDVALARADKLYGSAAWEAAATAYASVLAHAPAGWEPYPRAADAYLFSLIRADRNEECARAARDMLPKLAGKPSLATAASIGLDCALGLDAAVPDRAAAVAELERATRAALDDPQLGLSADDRSGLYISLLTAREVAKDEPGKRQVAGEWIAQLEAAAAAAATPEARAVFDSHRLSAYLEIGEPERAVPMLEASERDLPDDYNPPARLAVALHAMKQLDRALAASDRALAKSYGPRRLGILRTRAKIQNELGDRAAARATLETAIAEGTALPDGQRSEGMMRALRRELEILTAPPKPS